MSWCCVCCICSIVVLMVPGSAAAWQRFLLRHRWQIGWCAWLIAMINNTCKIQSRWWWWWCHKTRTFETDKKRRCRSAKIKLTLIQFRNKTNQEKSARAKIEKESIITYYALFCHRFDLMTQFGWMSVDPDPNRIHFRAPFYANVVVDFLNSAVFKIPQANI